MNKKLAELFHINNLVIFCAEEGGIRVYDGKNFKRRTGATKRHK